MNGAWQMANARFAALSARERALVAGAILLLIGLIGYYACLPKLARQRELNQSVASKQAELNTKRVLVTSLEAALAQNPELRQLERIRAQVLSLDQELQRRQKELITPQRMVSLLEGLLKARPRLQIQSLRILPAQTLGDGKANGVTTGTAKNNSLLYRHGIEVAIAGSYFDLLEYLQQVEQTPERKYFGRVQLAVEEYPRAVLTLQLHTVTLGPTWLAL